MGINVSIVSDNIALWDYIDKPDFYISKHIGYIETSFYLKMRNVSDAKIKQLRYIGIAVNTIFNFKQAQQLDKEIKRLEKHMFSKEKAFSVLEKSIKMALKNKDLYLKFEYE